MQQCYMRILSLRLTRQRTPTPDGGPLQLQVLVLVTCSRLADGQEACHWARFGMLVEGADRQEVCHWARFGTLIGGADGPGACHWARFGTLIGGADRHEASHWAIQQAMAGKRTTVQERRELDRVLRGIAIQAWPGMLLTIRGSLGHNSGHG